MNYSQSKEILAEVKKAKRILVNFHRGPDADSVGSALAIAKTLSEIGKSVTVIYTDKTQISDDLSFLPGVESAVSINFSDFDFSKYDLFIIPDSGSWAQITDDEGIQLPKITTIVIDHHATNPKFGNINLVDSKKSSCAGIVYLLLKDMDFKINSTVATLLLSGILSDTGMFRFSNDPLDLIHSAELVGLGADKDFIIDNLFGSMKYEALKMYGEFISRMEIDRGNKFTYTAVPYEVYKSLGKPPKASSHFSTTYGSAVRDVNFGVVMIEKEKNIIDISLRSKKGFDISQIAIELNGGGHKQAAGGHLEGIEFEKAVEKVLEVVRKHAKDNN